MEYFFGKNSSFANPHCSQFKECLKYLMINKSKFDFVQLVLIGLFFTCTVNSQTDDSA